MQYLTEIKEALDEMSEGSMTGPEKIFVKNAAAAVKNLRLAEKQIKVAVKHGPGLDSSQSKIFRPVEEIGEAIDDIDSLHAMLDQMMP
jgi:hypothetical protein